MAATTSIGNGPVGYIYKQTRFWLRTIRSLPAALQYRREITLLVSDITVGAGAVVIGGGMFFVVIGIAFFTGTEVGLEGFTGLSQIGAQAFTGVISALANVREITPLVAGLAFAAQVGAGFTAQLGAMRVSEEIDALEVIGVGSVGTRVWAALITMIPIYLAALFASFIASQLMVTELFHLSVGTYHHYFQLFLPPVDVLYSFIKAMVFVVAVTFIHCYYGYSAEGGPAGVGVAAGRAIRMSLIVVVVLNFFLSTVLYSGASGGARLIG